MIRTLSRLAAASAVIVACATPAFAHVTLEVGEAAVGGAYKAVLRLPHGCDGNATTSVTVKLPEGFINVKPMPKAGWTLDIKKGAYGATYKLYGADVKQGPLEITWSGGNLPDDQYDEFVMRGTVAAELKPDTTIFFPVIQKCTTGEEDWIDIPVDGQPEPDSPAPGLKLVAPGDGGHHH